MEEIKNEQEKEKTMKEIVAENFGNWTEALKSGEAEKVARLYDAENVDFDFLPTMSDEQVTDFNGVLNYFSHFLEKKPQPEIVKEKFRFYSNEVYKHSGLYNFEITDERGVKTIVNARFTYNWVKGEDGQWKIDHHHSSVLPKKH